jgi:hypothetical protein
VLGCAIIYILLIIERTEDVSLENPFWNNAVIHGRTGAVNYVQGVSEIGGRILDSCSIDHNKANFILARVLVCLGSSL